MKKLSNMYFFLLCFNPLQSTLPRNKEINALTIHVRCLHKIQNPQTTDEQRNYVQFLDNIY